VEREVRVAQVSVIAKLTAKEGKRDELLDHLRTLAKATEDEPGTLQYTINPSTTDPEVVWFYEVYADQDALVTHGGGDAMKAAGPAFAELLATRLELHICEPIAGKNRPG
jgi:quinol monooxygenase YgiN